jgi:cysteine synthase A/phenylacetate-CoA ligase
MPAESIDYRTPVREHVAKLTSLQPEVLYTMPSILYRILVACAEQQLAPAQWNIRHIILVGEVVTPAWLRLVAAQCGLATTDITDTLGSIEVGTIAYYSHHYGRYLLVEEMMAEGVGAEDVEDMHQAGDQGDQGTVADDGSTLAVDGRTLADEHTLAADEHILVLTTQRRTLFPVLRYVTYDVVQDLREIAVCGGRRHSFARIVRRVGPDQKHGEKISIYDIEQAVYTQLAPYGIAAVVSVYARRNVLEVSVATADALSPALTKQLEQALTHHIPGIGAMIEAGVMPSFTLRNPVFDDADYRSEVKQKKLRRGEEG